MSESNQTVVRWPELKRMTGLGRVTIWRWGRDGKFPRAVSLGPNCTGWLRSEVEDWLKARVAIRDARRGVKP